MSLLLEKETFSQIRTLLPPARVICVSLIVRVNHLKETVTFSDGKGVITLPREIGAGCFQSAYRVP